MGRLSAGRTDTTGLQTKFVETAVFGAGFAKPIVGKCLIHPAGEKELAKRAFDTKPFEGFFLFFSTLISKVCCRLSDFPGFPFFLWECPVEHDLGRLVVAVDVRRRERELRADALVAVPERVLI